MINGCKELENVIHEQRRLIDAGLEALPKPEGPFQAAPRKCELIVGEWGNWHSSAFNARPALYQPVSYTHLDVYKRQVNIESTKMIAVIPLLHGRCFICKICRKEKLVDFMLNKAKIFIQSGTGNCIRDKVICSCKDTFFCNFQTSCDNSKVKRWIIF